MRVEAMEIRMGESEDAPYTGQEFSVFLQGSHGRALALARAAVKDRGVAEDLTQEAFAEAYRKWDAVSTYRSPEAWVSRVILNQTASWIRRRGAERRAHSRLRVSVRPTIDVRSGDSGVWAHVNNLPRRQRDVVMLRYVLDMPRRDIAETLGCSEETVKTHLKRALSALARVVPTEAGHE